MNNDVKTVLSSIKHPIYLRFINSVKKRIYSSVCQLHAECAITHEPVSYLERKKLNYKTINRGEGWGDFFDCGWFCLTGKLDKKLLENAKQMVAILDLGGEGCVYDDDGVVQGITNVLGLPDKYQTIAGKKIIDFSKLKISDNGEIEIWVEVGNNGVGHHNSGKVKYKGASICIQRTDLLKFYYDFIALCQLMDISDKIRKILINSALNKAINISRDFSVGNIKKAQSVLDGFFKEKDKKDFTVYAVGHAHLDLAWLWPIRETKRKAERTFSNALANFEKYPDYVFGASQPQQFEWIKTNRPSLYQKIGEAIKKGNLEPQGAMWVEPDTNIPCGESLVRQCVYGKRFFKEEFGKDIDILWLPDVFGYSGALPQILKKCGVTKFMTIKLSWNSVNQFPYHTFNWKGIDGTSVLAHMPPEGNYVSSGNLFAVDSIFKQYKEKSVSKISLMPFGIGDGGAGPGEYHINMIKRCATINNIPKVKLASGAEFFSELEKDIDKYPSYQGELYLEKHRGTYTTQAKIKRFNRLAEQELHNAEWLCSVAYLEGFCYPHEEFERIWKEVLLYQFHDILPGSSIKRVYDEAYTRYPTLLEEIQTLSKNAIAFLSKTRADNKQYICNPTPYERKGFINDGTKLLEYDCLPYSTGIIKNSNKGFSDLSFSDNSIENKNLKAVFDSKGDIVELWDKETNTNCVKTAFNALRIYDDKRMIPYDAWDINPNYYKKKPSNLKLISTSTAVDDDCIIKTTKYEFNKSEITQKIILKSKSNYLRFDTVVDWQETHKMLRADFTSTINADKVLCDIQFGSIERSTKDVTSQEKAQFEICAHKWVDLYDGQYGVSVLNNCKYGYRVKDGKISLNLLRSTVYPDPVADKGAQQFSYAVYPHKAAPSDSSLFGLGYEINNPLELKTDFLINQVAQIDNKNVILETICVNRNGDLVLRLFEKSGEAQNCNLEIAVENAELFETDMLYENAQKTDKKLSFKPYEIKTIIVKKINK